MGHANVPGLPIPEGVRSMDECFARVVDPHPWEEARSLVPSSTSKHAQGE